VIFRTPILALLLVSMLACVVALGSGAFGWGVLRRWNLASGARAQLVMERRTQLVSTLFGFVMAAELAALLLFVFNADRMASLFVGAMCAVGTLNVNAYGFPALYARIAVFFAAAVWLILDRADRMGRDYPLTRLKYGVLIGMVPLVLASAGLELSYFLNLRTDVITSCCSKLFTPANPGLSDEMAAVPPKLALQLLVGGGVLVTLSGVLSLRTGRGRGLFAALGAGFFALALVAVVSVISIYIYENPNHHCPFCILKPEYGYFGYALYVPLFTATAAALGVGALSPFTRVESLRARLPALMNRLTLLSLLGFALFGLACAVAILRSHLILFG